MKVRIHFKKQFDKLNVSRYKRKMMQASSSSYERVRVVKPLLVVLAVVVCIFSSFGQTYTFILENSDGTDLISSSNLLYVSMGNLVTFGDYQIIWDGSQMVFASDNNNNLTGDTYENMDPNDNYNGIQGVSIPFTFSPATGTNNQSTVSFSVPSSVNNSYPSDTPTYITTDNSSDTLGFPSGVNPPGDYNVDLNLNPAENNNFLSPSVTYNPDLPLTNTDGGSTNYPDTSKLLTQAETKFNSGLYWVLGALVIYLAIKYILKVAKPKTGKRF